MTSLLHFEDFAIGQIYDCGTYALTRDAIIAFARAFDPQPQHLDDAAAQHTILKGLAASGWQVSAIIMRQVALGVLNRCAGQGGVGAEEGRWIKPVRPGDRLRVEAEVVKLKPSRSKPMGFVTITCRAHRGDELVALVTMTPIIAMREAP